MTQDDICKLWAKRDISSTSNEDDVVLELYEEGEFICLFRSRGFSDELSYLYLSLLDDF